MPPPRALRGYEGGRGVWVGGGRGVMLLLGCGEPSRGPRLAGVALRA